MASIPPYHTTVVYGDTSYLYYGGVYYQAAPAGGYVIVQAPLGVVADAPPAECAVVEVGELSYCYHFGTLYLWDVEADGYKVVAPPVGATVTYLPEGHEVRYVSGAKYHAYASVYYRPVYRGTTVVYQVVKSPG